MGTYNVAILVRTRTATIQKGQKLYNTWNLKPQMQHNLQLTDYHHLSTQKQKQKKTD